MPKRKRATKGFTSTELAERAIHRCALEAAIWGMPVVNYELMFRELVRKLEGDFNQVLHWPRLLDCATRR